MDSQDDIQENTDSMEEKLEALGEPDQCPVNSDREQEDDFQDEIDPEQHGADLS